MPPQTRISVPLLPALSTNTRHYLADTISSNTRRAYAGDLKRFSDWCRSRSLSPLPAAAASEADFLSSQAMSGRSPSTLNRRVAAIRYAHEAHGYPSPTTDKLVSATLKGIRRSHRKPPRRKTAATIEKMITLLAHCNTATLRGKRDKALLLLGFAGAFRRSELVALQVSALAFVPEGLRIMIRHSKTDQDGQGQEIAILNGRLCIVTVLQDWINSAAIQDGYLFRGFYKGSRRLRATRLSGQAVADIIKHYALKAGFDPDEFAGHSLRAGFVTSAAESGASLFRIMDVSRHRSVQSVRTYVRTADAFRNHAGSGFL